MLQRALYRSMLRATRFGECPEVLGEYGSVTLRALALEDAAKNGGRGPALDVPDTAQEVRARMKQAFLSGTGVIPSAPSSEEAPWKAPSLADESSNTTKNATSSGFAVLKKMSDLNIFAVQPGDKLLPSKLPVFEFSGGVCLPGESTKFNFFEPRYKLLTRQALDNGGFFLQRSTAEYDPTKVKAAQSAVNDLFLRKKPTESGGRLYLDACVLLKITDHMKMADGNYGVLCAAGPRIFVKETSKQIVDGGEAPTLTVATEFEVMKDGYCSETAFGGGGETDSSSDVLKNAIADVEGAKTRSSTPQTDPPSPEEMRARILDQLATLVPPRALFARGLPPLDPERFSFFAMHFLVNEQDMASRIFWMSQRNTHERLRETHRKLASIIVDRTREDEDAESTSNDA